MAGNIQGITIQFRGETTELDQALKKINTETKDLDRELKKVDTALKFNPTNIELWRQKQTLLTNKVKDTKEKLDTLKKAQAEMDANSVDENSREYRELRREIIETESKLKTFEGKLKNLGNIKLQAVSAQFKELGDKLTTAGQAMAPFSAAGAAVAGSLGALAVKSGAAADDLSTLSKVTGISTQQLQLYKAGADLVDVSVETIAKSQQKLTKNMASAASGTGTQADAFKKLGVSVTNADGSLKSSDQVFNEVIKALGGVENETERNALAMTLMGKSAMELNPLIEDGGKTYEQLAKTMSENDLKFADEEAIEGANRFNDALDTLKASGLATLQTVGTQLASYLAPAMEKIAGALEKVLGWLSQLSPQTLTIIGIIASVIAVIAPLLLFFGKIAFAISSITGLMGTLGLSFGAIVAPIGIAVAAIAAIIAIGVLLYKNWDKIKAAAQALWANITATFNNIKTAISNALMAALAKVVSVWRTIETAIGKAVIKIKTSVSQAFNNVKTTISNIFSSIVSTATNTWNKVKDAITKPIEKAKEMIKNAINKIKEIVGGVKLQLPHFKLPHFHLSGGKAPFGLGGKGSLPHFSVDWYAKGGIFDNPTIIGIGEKGSEAVVPLDKLWTKLDNIASASSGGGVVINIYPSPGMDERALASEVKRQIINEVKGRRDAWA